MLDLYIDGEFSLMMPFMFVFPQGVLMLFSMFLLRSKGYA